MITRGEFVTLQTQVDYLWRSIRELTQRVDGTLVGKGIHELLVEKDFQLLCDFLGVEVIDAAAKRAVVKKRKR